MPILKPLYLASIRIQQQERAVDSSIARIVPLAWMLACPHSSISQVGMTRGKSSFISSNSIAHCGPRLWCAVEQITVCEWLNQGILCGKAMHGTTYIGKWLTLISLV